MSAPSGRRHWGRTLGATKMVPPPMPTKRDILGELTSHERRGHLDFFELEVDDRQKAYRIATLMPTNESASPVRMRNVTGSLPSRRSCDAWLRRRSHSMSSAVKRPKRTQRNLDAERHRLRHRVVNAAEHLVPGQPIVQLRLLAGRGGREVPADFQLVREAGGGADGVGFGVPRPQVAIVQRDQAQTAPDPDVRGQAATTREIDMDVREEVVRRDAADAVLGPLDLAVQLGEGGTGRARHRRGLIVLGLPMEPLGLNPGSCQPRQGSLALRRGLGDRRNNSICADGRRFVRQSQ